MSNLIKTLKSAGLLSEQKLDLGYVPTGSYALNRIMGGGYDKGFPIGYITQLCGESSTAKTVFVTEGLAQAQKLGYYTVLIDSENAFSPKFAATLGIDAEKLIYAAPPSLEACFNTIENIIEEIREQDEDTPIVIGYDSISVSPVQAELDPEDYKQNNMLGALRAKVTGDCLRRLNTIVRDKKVALLVINQLREKVNVMYGDPSTPAAGGKSLPFYLGVEMRTTAARSERILDEKKRVTGIRGKIKNTKNKVAIPFRETVFELVFDKGLNPYYGLLECLVEDGYVDQAGAWYTEKETGTKFQRKGFEALLTMDDTFEGIRKMLGMEKTDE